MITLTTLLAFLVNLIILALVLGLVCWVINLVVSLLPVQFQPLRVVLYVLVALITLLYVISLFGGIAGFHGPFVRF